MKKSDFPKETEFYIKEFDVPLAYIPGKGWFNYYGGKSTPYNVKGLKPGNSWFADSFAEWFEIVDKSSK